ncbi:MAG: hypothetical protein RBS85_02715 [Methanofastidiosum sp.]|jgi:hypothetical protein|nr:hypothetical protein [Methanofastidiosum sp.]
MNETYCKTIENYIDAYNKFDIDMMILDIDIDIKFENIFNNDIDMKLNGIENFKEQQQRASICLSIENKR